MCLEPEQLFHGARKSHFHNRHNQKCNWVHKGNLKTTSSSAQPLVMETTSHDLWPINYENYLEMNHRCSSEYLVHSCFALYCTRLYIQHRCHSLLYIESGKSHKAQCILRITLVLWKLTLWSLGRV